MSATSVFGDFRATVLKINQIENSQFMAMIKLPSASRREKMGEADGVARREN
jgi:hypothetical protein